MTISPFGSPRVRLACAVALAATLAGPGSARPSAQAAGKAAPAQKLDADYTAKIKAATADPRILTELVDHMPASDKVPSPLKFLGYIPGEPGKLTYHKDIVRYLEALDKASDRVTMMKIGESDEGRDMVAVVVADEATIKNLDKYRQITAQLTDPRKLTDAQAKQLIATGKPIYYAHGQHPLAGSRQPRDADGTRLPPGSRGVTVHPDDSQQRRSSCFTPASEVDGREKQVDNFRAQAAGQPSPSMVYWGKYVQHDNNRDGIGVGLRLTQVMLKTFLDWHPTVWHDLHESVTLLYTSTGTGPYNSVVDPIQVNEWWLLAQTEIMEMTKRDVPGVWTYNYYDGWVPNYMFWIGVTHNSIGRFYETQSYGGAVNRPLPVTQSREWYRPNPTPPDMTWGPRNNVNMQESALLLAMNYVAKNKETFLENYYLKNKHTIERGRAQGAVCLRDSGEAAAQGRGGGADEPDSPRGGRSSRRRRRVHARLDRRSRRATTSSASISRTAAIVETLLGAAVLRAGESAARTTIPAGRSRSSATSRRYRVEDKSVFDKPMTLATADFKIAGAIAGTGRTLIVDHTTDNTLVTFRFQHKDVKMAAAEKEFEAGGHTFSAGRVRDRGREPRRAGTVDQGARAVGVGRRRAARACRCTTSTCRGSATSTPGRAPRMKAGSGWHSTTSRFRTPTSRAPKLREGNLKSKYDVIVFPHAGQGGTALITGGVQGNEPRPYKKTDLTPNVGTVDTTDDMRGSIGVEGLDGAVQVRPGRRRADHRGGDLHGLPRVQPDAGRLDRNAGQPVCARLCAEGAARRSQQPGALRLRPERARGATSIRPR